MNNIQNMNNSEHLEILRHDTAHVMAMAVQELYPETQVTIGPVIENGFSMILQEKSPSLIVILK